MSNRARTPALRRAADSNSPFPPQSRGSNSNTPNGSRKSRHHHSSSYDGEDFGVSSARDTSSSRKDQSAVTARSNLLQPRVAVVLGLSEAWHLLLFLCRLLSIVPAVWWGFPLGLRLLALLHLMFSGNLEASAGTDGTFEARLRMTETLLATIWCGASGYLSFFFTDCLMSRWLVHYTPQATLIRLVTIAITNVYLTSRALWLTGGHADPRLLLPVWIFISTTLTILYHVTQRKINIRKETSMSISVFSIASFISMVALLAQLHSNRTDYPPIPLVTISQSAWQGAGRGARKILEYAASENRRDIA